MTEKPKYLTVTEVSERLRVAPQTVRYMIQRDELAAVRVGKLWRIPIEAIEALEGSAA